MTDDEARRFEEFVDPVDGTRWRVDVDFLASGWRCRWGDGCVGILDEPAAELEQGCCSVGAELLDPDEAMQIAALSATLGPEIWERRGSPVFGDDDRSHTAIVDGACVFFNRPGFAGGVGCALHLAAEADGDEPMDWKPAVCWQLPLKVDRTDPDRPMLRRWTRADWGSGGESMAWCCTERHTADQVDCHDAETPVAVRLGGEIEALIGPDVASDVAHRVTGRRGRDASTTTTDR